MIGLKRKEERWKPIVDVPAEELEVNDITKLLMSSENYSRHERLEPPVYAPLSNQHILSKIITDMSAKAKALMETEAAKERGEDVEDEERPPEEDYTLDTEFTTVVEDTKHLGLYDSD
jgi:hypothetical protein